MVHIVFRHALAFDNNLVKVVLVIDHDQQRINVGFRTQDDYHQNQTLALCVENVFRDPHDVHRDYRIHRKVMSTLVKHFCSTRDHLDDRQVNKSNRKSKSRTLRQEKYKENIFSPLVQMSKITNSSIN